MQALWPMWLSASLCLLDASPLFVEKESTSSRICKPVPHWNISDQAPMKQLLGNVVVVALLKATWHFCLTQAARVGELRDKLARGNLTDIAFLIVNEQDAMSRAMYWELKRRAAKGIPVYQQTPLQKDVWEILEGDKDDFLVYDRCGFLTFHIVLPYSFLHYPYVEAAIRATYHKDICNCSLSANSTMSADNKKPELTEPAVEPPTSSLHHHHHTHHHHHHPPHNNTNEKRSEPKEPTEHSHKKHSLYNIKR